MISISITAAAGLDIIRRISSGELEIYGIQIRDVATKQIRYVIRGAENFPRDLDTLGDVPSLASLRAALNTTQILQLVAIAQNAAAAMSMRRIERRLEAVENQLSGIEERLRQSQVTDLLILDGQRAEPVSRLKAAKSAAIAALRHQDKNALISAAQGAEQAAHDLLAQTTQLIHRGDRGLPAAILYPNDLANLAESTVEAACIASAMWLALGKSEDIAYSLMRTTSEALSRIRHQISAALSNPDLLLRRTEMDSAQHATLREAGLRLKNAVLQASGRTEMIRLGLVNNDLLGGEFERLVPASQLTFLPVSESA
jgi:hypothetical protein